MVPAFEFTKKNKPLTEEEKYPLRGKSIAEKNDYFKNGNWPDDRVRWKEAFSEFLT